MHSHVPAQKQHRISSPYSVHIFLICTLIHSSRRKLCPTCDLRVQINYLLPFLSKAETSIQIPASQRQLRSVFMCLWVWVSSWKWENDCNLLHFGSESDLFPESSYACRNEIRLETDIILYSIKRSSHLPYRNHCNEMCCALLACWWVQKHHPEDTLDKIFEARAVTECTTPSVITTLF